MRLSTLRKLQPPLLRATLDAQPFCWTSPKAKAIQPKLLPETFGWQAPTWEENWRWWNTILEAPVQPGAYIMTEDDWKRADAAAERATCYPHLYDLSGNPRDPNDAASIIDEALAEAAVLRDTPGATWGDMPCVTITGVHFFAEPPRPRG